MLASYTVVETLNPFIECVGKLNSYRHSPARPVSFRLSRAALVGRTSVDVATATKTRSIIIPQQETNTERTLFHLYP